MVEPAQLHTCAMHGGLAIERAAAGTLGANVAPEMATHVRMHDHSHHGKDSKSRQCSCLGDCSGASATVGLPSAGVSVVQTPIGAGAAASFAYRSPSVTAPDFLLQFANGPPAILTRA